MADESHDGAKEAYCTLENMYLILKDPEAME